MSAVLKALQRGAPSRTASSLRQGSGSACAGAADGRRLRVSFVSKTLGRSRQLFDQIVLGPLPEEPCALVGPKPTLGLGKGLSSCVPTGCRANEPGGQLHHLVGFVACPPQKVHPTIRAGVHPALTFPPSSASGKTPAKSKVPWPVALLSWAMASPSTRASVLQFTQEGHHKRRRQNTGLAHQLKKSCSSAANSKRLFLATCLQAHRLVLLQALALSVQETTLPAKRPNRLDRQSQFAPCVCARQACPQRKPFFWEPFLEHFSGTFFSFSPGFLVCLGRFLDPRVSEASQLH